MSGVSVTERITQPAPRKAISPVIGDQFPDANIVDANSGIFGSLPASDGLLLSRAPAADSTELASRGLASQKSVRIAIRSKEGVLLLDPVDIVAVEAQGNYVLLKQRVRSHLLRESISAMAGKLEQYGFIRIHRSVLVNRSHVEDIRPAPRGKYSLRVRAGNFYTVSRRYRGNLRLLAELWIGAEP